MSAQRAIDAALAHYNLLKDSVEKIRVPEWDLDVYYTPITLHEMREIQSKSKGDDFLFAAEIVIKKSLDRDGNRLFSLDDKQKLLRGADPIVVSNLAKRLSQGNLIDDDAIEDFEKN